MEEGALVAGSHVIEGGSYVTIQEVPELEAAVSNT